MGRLLIRVPGGLLGFNPVRESLLIGRAINLLFLVSYFWVFVWHGNIIDLAPTTNAIFAKIDMQLPRFCSEPSCRQ